MSRILVVDDDPGIVQLISFRLTRSGFEVDTAADGESALGRIRDTPPDLVLLDILMPGLSGLDVLAEIRASEQTAQLPVIMLTAKTLEGDIELGFERGATDYIVKPFSPRELVSRVNAAIARTGG
ncbi:response regulator [Natronosporangium hydrolyticum]|uniref:Response regulator n=1 Tax=Natronosporangium hydrolyticum TaxID=2811111 RepID=A0A895YFV1_9ACTN|nr:response regulator [Natronosporangium hydrolyticum]QSB16451.1 response regulator [Natronosporangium hydrolyticum]